MGLAMSTIRAKQDQLLIRRGIQILFLLIVISIGIQVFLFLRNYQPLICKNIFRLLILLRSILFDIHLLPDIHLQAFLFLGPQDYKLLKRHDSILVNFISS